MAKGEMLTRWLNLLIAIQGGRPYTVRELSERTGVSTRTIFRDLKGMQEAGVPIYYDNGYRLMEEWSISPLHFTSDELIALVTALNFVRRAGPLRSRQSVVPLVDKLMAALPNNQRETAGQLDRALVIDPLPSRGMEDEQVIRSLEQAAGDRRKVAIRYAAFSHGGEESERVVRPYGLTYRGTALYLIGFCELRGGIRTFRVGRIRAIRPLGEHFRMPADFDLDHFLLDLWGITDGPEMNVQLRFDPLVAPLARETEWHHSQQVDTQADGSAVVTMTTRGRAELARWLAGYGGHVLVLNPPELREAVREIGLGILAAYPAD
jgi:predicted DNA-binding transcriptional regulator YafY